MKEGKTVPADPRVNAAVVAIIQRGGDLLLTQRNNTRGHGKWGFPGGWLGYGEDAFAAAYREVEEETGLLVRPLREDGFFVRTWEDGQYHIVTLLVICKYLGGKPVNMEPEKALNVCWMPMDHLVELDLFDSLDSWLRRPKASTYSET